MNLIQLTLPKIKEYFDNLKSMFLERKLSETFDVQNYQYDGTDRNGLHCWLHRRGSNRSENLHKKMKIAFGTRSYGAEVGHYLLLLLCYCYNLSTGCRHGGKYNFGMTRMDIIDRIQIQIEESFCFDIFPLHTNQSQFQFISNFVAIGIGLLSYDNDFVKQSLIPNKHLKGDLKFMASRMGLEAPPLGVRTKEEKKTFSSFLKKLGRNPNSKDFINLAKHILTRCNSITAYPKLPSILKAFYQQ